MYKVDNRMRVTMNCIVYTAIITYLYLSITLANIVIFFFEFVSASEKL